MNSNINTQSLVYHTARKPSLLTKLHLKFSLSRQQSKIVSKYQRKNTWVPGKWKPIKGKKPFCYYDED